MIQLDKQVAAKFDENGEVTGWNTQAVLLPNHFFLNPNITFDWEKNTCTLDGTTYYLDKNILKSASTSSIPSESEWKNTYGNRIEYVYYDFKDSKNNPSGNAENLYRSLYIDSLNRIKYIFQYKWDLADNCTCIQSLAPEGAEAQQEKIFVTLTRWSKGVKINPTEKCLLNEDVVVKWLPDDFVSKFVGWLYEGELLPQGEGRTSIIHMDKNVELTAKWLYLYTVTRYIGPGNNGFIAPIPLEEGTMIEVPSEQYPDTETQMLTGWTANGQPFDKPFILSENVTIRGVWKKICYLSVDKANGEEVVKIKKAEGYKFNMSELDAILMSGSTYIDIETGSEYELKGWKLEDGSMVDTDITINSDTIITAVWELKSTVSDAEDTEIDNEISEPDTDIDDEISEP